MRAYPLIAASALMLGAPALSAGCGTDDGSQARVPIQERACPEARAASTAAVPDRVRLPEGARLIHAAQDKGSVLVVAEVEGRSLGDLLAEVRSHLPPDAVRLFEEQEQADAESSYRVGSEMLLIAMRVVCRGRVEYRVNLVPAPG